MYVWVEADAMGTESSNFLLHFTWHQSRDIRYLRQSHAGGTTILTCYTSV